MEHINQSPQKNTRVPHDIKTCPFAVRVQALQTELAYYKAICLAYQSGRLKAQGSSRRLTIHKINCKNENKTNQINLQSHQMKDFKQQQKKFSDHIERKIKRGIQKKSDDIEVSANKNTIHESQVDFSNKSRISLKPTKQDINALTHSSYQAPVSLSSEQNISKLKEQTDQIPQNVIENLTQNLPMINIINEQQAHSHKSSSSSQKLIKPSLPLIADLCIFGCVQKSLRQLPNQKVIEVEPQLVLSMFDYNSQQYYDQISKYLYPNGLFCRKMRNEKLLGEVNQILLQNIKKHSNFIYRLKSELSLSDLTKQQRELLKRINPNLHLFCISIKINDFTIIDADQILSDQQKQNQTSKTSDKNTGGASNRSDNYKPKDIKQDKDIKNCSIYSNKRTISIFTYYPFFQFFQSFLISIYNALKVQKLGIYQNKLETIFQVDSNYNSSRLQMMYTPLVSQINNTLLASGLDYQFTLGVDILKISTQGHKLSDAWIGNWIFTILKLFDKNTFYDTLSAILFEQQVIFVCDNPHILTYTIYLFTQILLRPFHYQHSIVYMVSQWDLLDAPTPIVLGINKSSDWLCEANMKQGHFYVQIGQETTLVDRRKDNQRIRSKKLREICSVFFKKIDRDSMTLFKQKKKKDGVEYNMSCTKEQKTLCMNFITALTTFLKQQLIDTFPNENYISNVKQKFKVNNPDKSQDAATVISQQIIRQLLKHRKEKDPFIQKLVRCQLFLTYLFDVIKLQE